MDIWICSSFFFFWNECRFFVNFSPHSNDNHKRFHVFLVINFSTSGQFEFGQVVSVKNSESNASRSFWVRMERTSIIDPNKGEDWFSLFDWANLIKSVWAQINSLLQSSGKYHWNLRFYSWCQIRCCPSCTWSKAMWRDHRTGKNFASR